MQIEHLSNFVKARQLGQRVVHLMQTLRLRGRPSPIIFARIIRPMNALTTLLLTVFTQRNFVEEFLQPKCDFTQKTAVLRFWATLWRLRDNVWCSSYAYWKAWSRLPISVNWTFLPCVTAEALRAKIDRKSAFCKGVGQYMANFHVEADVPYQSFLHGYLGQWMPHNFFPYSFHTKKLCNRFSLSEVRFYTENGRFAFLSPLWGLKGNVRCSS